MATRNIKIDTNVEELVDALAAEDGVTFDVALNKAAKTGCSRLWALRKYSGKGATAPKKAKKKAAKKSPVKKAATKKATKKAATKKATKKAATKKRTAKKTSSAAKKAAAKAKAK